MWRSFREEFAKLATAPVAPSIEIPRAVPSQNTVSTSHSRAGTVNAKPGSVPKPGKVHTDPVAGPAGLNASGQATPPPSVRS